MVKQEFIFIYTVVHAYRNMNVLARKDYKNSLIDKSKIHIYLALYACMIKKTR